MIWGMDRRQIISFRTSEQHDVVITTMGFESAELSFCLTSSASEPRFLLKKEITYLPSRLQ